VSKYQFQKSDIYQPGTDLPINRLNIGDAEILQEVEAQLLQQAYLPSFIPAMPVIPAQAGIQHTSSNMKQPTVYIMASQRNGTLYVGVTSNLVQRVWQHKNHVVQGFTEKYHVELLVWFGLSNTKAWTPPFHAKRQ
jgi:hypothetical protein